MKVLISNADARIAEYDFVSALKMFDPQAQVHLVRSLDPDKNVYLSDRGYMSERVIFSDDRSPLFMPTLTKICELEGVDRIIAMGEDDVLPAAVIRQKLGIDGIVTQTAMLFRDKVKMKERAREIGLRVPRFRNLESLESALQFSEEIGFPLILKMKFGLSSIGIKKPGNREELIAAFNHIQQAGQVAGYEIEEFIDGNLFHVDGYVVEDAPIVAWPTSCSAGCLDLAVGKSMIIDQVLESAHPKFDALREFSVRLIHGFGLVNSTFHIEIFEEKKTGDLVLLEAACRTGGDPVPTMLKESFGLDMDHVSIRLQLANGLNELQAYAHEFQSIKAPKRFTASVSIPVRTGVLTATGTNPPAGTQMNLFVKRHNAYYQWQTIGSIACNGFASGDSYAEASKNIESFIDWYERSFVWKKKSYFSLFVRGIRKLRSRIEDYIEYKTSLAQKSEVVLFLSPEKSSVRVLNEISRRHRIGGIVEACPEAGRERFRGYARLRSIPYFCSSSEQIEALAGFLSSLGVDSGVAWDFPYSVPVQFMRSVKYGVHLIHPSLLPLYSESNASKKMFEKQDRYGGVTVVEMGDVPYQGPIRAQEAIEIQVGHSESDYRSICAASGAEHVSKILSAKLAGRKVPVLYPN